MTPERKTIELTDRVYFAMLRQLYIQSPKEACGFVMEGLTEPDEEDRSRPREVGEMFCWGAKNTHDSPTDSFTIDMDTHREVMEMIRDGDARVVGIFHSHPGGDPVPSPIDRASFVPEGWVYFVIGDSSGVPKVNAWDMSGVAPRKMKIVVKR